MEYRKLGSTGLEVSPLCLGCMSFGNPQDARWPWSLDEEASRLIIRRAIEAGINFFDTANAYSAGRSEEITGRALAEFGNREEIVLATKVHGRVHEGPNGAGLSRKAILAEIDNSLRRLGADYVDLYQIHRFDQTTPVEETIEALHDVVKAGKARYIGASLNVRVAVCQDAAHCGAQWLHQVCVDAESLQPPVPRTGARDVATMRRPRYRGDPVESSLARGRLTRDWDDSSAAARTTSSVGVSTSNGTAPWNVPSSRPSARSQRREASLEPRSRSRGSFPRRW